MPDTQPPSRPRTAWWLLVVCLLIFLAFIAHAELTRHSAALRIPATILPMLLAVVITQRTIRTRSAHPPAFAALLALFFVAAITALEFLALTVGAIFFVPSPPM